MPKTKKLDTPEPTEEALAILTQILKDRPWSKADEYAQHPNGGGWVQKTAAVAAAAYVALTAQVYDTARVCGSARVYDTARVYGSAWVYDSARVYGSAWVYDSAWAKTPLSMTGTKWLLSHSKEGYISIGCHIYSIKEWFEKGRTIGSVEGFTSADMDEYELYIKVFRERDIAVFGPNEFNTWTEETAEIFGRAAQP